MIKLHGKKLNHTYHFNVTRSKTVFLPFIMILFSACVGNGW